MLVWVWKPQTDSQKIKLKSATIGTHILNSYHVYYWRCEIKWRHHQWFQWPSDLLQMKTATSSDLLQMKTATSGCGLWNNPSDQWKSWWKWKKMSKVKLFTWLFFSHMIADHTKLLVMKVHERVFMNEIDSCTSDVTWVSMEIKYDVQVKTYRCKWGIIWM